MHSLGDIRTQSPLHVVSVKFRTETMDFMVEYTRDGFTWFKTISVEVFADNDNFKKFLNELITEVQNG